MRERRFDSGRVHLYGWDSRRDTWHGPSELGDGSALDKRLLRQLRAAPAKSWYGPVHCCRTGKAEGRFFALVHDLGDCAMAMIYCDESKAGPAEVLAVASAGRLSRLREDFAFEFLAFARFLGSIAAGAEVEVHDAVAAALRDQEKATSLVFSISIGSWPADLDPTLSRCVEMVARTLCRWLDDPAPPVKRNSHHVAARTPLHQS